MPDLNDILDKLYNILRDSNKEYLSKVNNLHLFMIPPTDRLPSICIVPITENYSSYTSKYYNTRYEVTIDVYDFGYNRKESQEKTVDIIRDIKHVIDNDFSLNDYVDVIGITSDITSDERKIGNKFLTWSSMDIFIEQKNTYDTSYPFTNTIQTKVDFDTLKKQFLNYFKNNLSDYFNEFNIMPIDTVHKTPSCILNFKTSEYDYKSNNFNHINIELEVSLLSRFYFRKKAVEKNIELLEYVKQEIKSNYQLNGYCDSIMINYTDFNIEKIGNNFFNIINLNTTVSLRNG